MIKCPLCKISLEPVPVTSSPVCCALLQLCDGRLSVRCTACWELTIKKLFYAVLWSLDQFHNLCDNLCDTHTHTHTHTHMYIGISKYIFNLKTVSLNCAVYQVYSEYICHIGSMRFLHLDTHLAEESEMIA